jgi:FkbM family methyltransferase
MRLPTGEWITLPLSSHFASEVFVTGADVDWGSEKLFNLVIDGHGAFLDVGANIGYYSLYLLPKVSAVYSFEPDPRARKSLEVNASGKPKITVVPSAIGAKKGEALFVLDESSETSHLATASEKNQNMIKVDVTTIDAFVTERGISVECIKVDAEGLDLEVLAGAINVLIGQQPLVLTEARPDAALFALIEKAGYRVFAFIRDARTRERAFAELQRGIAPGGATKMLFLVPSRLVERFKAP